MRTIDGFITDKVINDGDYQVYQTPAEIGILYSSDIRCGTDVRTYIKKLPNFDEVYDCFLSCKSTLLKRNKIQDICLSLFFQPYFSEFYDRLKQDRSALSQDKKKTLKKYLLDYLASEVHNKGVMDYDVGGQELKQWYIEKDVYNKSKELIELLT